LVEKRVRRFGGFGFANRFCGMGVPPVLLRGFGFENRIFSLGGFGFARAFLTRLFFVPRLLAQLP
jgi:hypothetical protein